MPNVSNSQVLGPYLLRAQSDGLFNPNEIAQKIENMYLLEEGTLRSVWGPTAFVPLKTLSTTPGVYGPLGGGEVGDRPWSRWQSVSAPLPVTSSSGGGAASSAVLNRGIDPSEPYYGFRQHGLFHANLPNGRDVLLLHTGDELWEFRGWRRNWRQLLSSPASIYGLEDVLVDSGQAKFPTQFTATGNGVVIVPQDGRAYFYDGYIIAPLGFSDYPAAPLGQGPQSSEEKLQGDFSGINDVGYAHSSARKEAVVDDITAIPWDTKVDEYSAGSHTAMTNGFGDCRIGTITTIPIDDPNTLATGTSGWVEQGAWRCVVQYVDRWGNLSALSPPSNPVTCDLRPAVLLAGVGSGMNLNIRGAKDIFVDVPFKGRKARPQKVRIQVKWDGIPTGPEHCVGRRLYRTKDLENSGDPDYYYLTQNALSTTRGFATLPDNVVTAYPDNIPDGWLTEPAKDVLPMGRFKLSTMALGRHWIANLDGRPGTARPSEPGFWGTFLKGNDITPDSASEITGMHAVPGGLLLCTVKSTFLVEAADAGGFTYRPLSASIGCAAPGSMVTLSDGKVVWLGFDGFYSYDGATVAYLSPPLRKTFKRATRSRLTQAVGVFDPKSREYRCWVSLDGDRENNTCFVMGPDGWRTRTDVVADSVCVTQDHRQYMLVGGRLPGDVSRSGVFLLDHDASPDIPSETASREAIIETSWLEANSSDQAKTSYVVYLWLRETESTDVTIEVLRNWRETVIESSTTKRYSEKDVPLFWGTSPLGTGVWRTGRPYWTRAAVHVPSAESVKFRIRGRGAWEFVGFQVELAPRYYGGAQLTP